MLIRGFLLKYAAGLFILFRLLPAAGFAAYTIWFAPPREPPLWRNSAIAFLSGGGGVICLLGQFIKNFYVWLGFSTIEAANPTVATGFPYLWPLVPFNAKAFSKRYHSPSAALSPGVLPPCRPACADRPACLHRQARSRPCLIGPFCRSDTSPAAGDLRASLTAEQQPKYQGGASFFAPLRSLSASFVV